jgi:hypothetical protein
VPQLQRQIAYDRLLEWLYMVDEGWILKPTAFGRGRLRTSALPVGKRTVSRPVGTATLE